VAQSCVRTGAKNRLCSASRRLGKAIMDRARSAQSTLPPQTGKTTQDNNALKANTIVKGSQAR